MYEYKIPTVEDAQVHKTNKLSSKTNYLYIRNQTTTSNPASQKITKHLKGKHKIILVGDNHVRECISKLQDKQSTSSMQRDWICKTWCGSYNCNGNSAENILDTGLVSQLGFTKKDIRTPWRIIVSLTNYLAKPVGDNRKHTFLQ
jgi:hypothetical protein